MYLQDSAIEIDNNLVGNAIRPAAVEEKLAVFRECRGRPTLCDLLQPSSKAAGSEGWKLMATCAAS
jgi:hypothetical protein